MSAGRSDGGAAARPRIFCCIYDDAVPPCASRRSQLWRIALVWGFRISCPSPPSCPHCRVGPFAPIQTMKGKHSVVISPPLVPASPRSVMLLRGVRVASVTCDPGRSREVGSGASLQLCGDDQCPPADATRECQGRSPSGSLRGNRVILEKTRLWLQHQCWCRHGGRRSQHCRESALRPQATVV